MRKTQQRTSLLKLKPTRINSQPAATAARTHVVDKTVTLRTAQSTRYAIPGGHKIAQGVLRKSLETELRTLYTAQPAANLKRSVDVFLGGRV